MFAMKQGDVSGGQRLADGNLPGFTRRLVDFFQRIADLVALVLGASWLIIASAWRA